ncbi:MAG: hypothetical protein GXP60_02405 [Epsilonproteobacteria bacterium]|nr:hypothetical protein [Campylobacterota bacterium]
MEVLNWSVFESFSYAKTLSGVVEYKYEKRKDDNLSYKSRSASFTQNYKLRYNRYIYSPKLLIADIEGSFQKENIDITESNVGKTNINAKNIGYNFHLRFLKDTKHPFSVFANKNEETTWMTQPGGAMFVNMKTKSIGINGGAYLGYGINGNYGFYHAKSKSIDDKGNFDKIDNKNFIVGINKSYKNSWLNLSYNYSHNIEKKNENINIKRTSESINNIIANYSNMIDKNTNFNLFGKQYNDNLYRLTITQLNGNLSKKLSKRLSSNTNLYLTRSKYKGKNGEYIMLDNNFNYILNKHFTITQSLEVYKNLGFYGNNSKENLSLGLNFNKLLPGKINISASSILSGIMRQKIEKESAHSLSFTQNADISKLFVFKMINSTLRPHASFGISRSYPAEKTDRYDSGLEFDSNIIKHVKFNTSFEYYRYKHKSIDGETDSEIRRTSDASVTYSSNIGFRGNFSTSIGTTITSGTSSEKYGYARCNFGYMIERGLLLNANLNIRDDMTYNTTTASMAAGIRYRYRSLIMSFDGSFNKERTDVGKRKWSTVLYKISRLF